MRDMLSLTYPERYARSSSRVAFGSVISRGILVSIEIVEDDAVSFVVRAI
jgi:hypothetical protein